METLINAFRPFCRQLAAKGYNGEFTVNTSAAGLLEDAMRSYLQGCEERQELPLVNSFVLFTCLAQGNQIEDISAWFHVNYERNRCSFDAEAMGMVTTGGRRMEFHFDYVGQIPTRQQALEMIRSDSVYNAYQQNEREKLSRTLDDLVHELSQHGYQQVVYPRYRGDLERICTTKEYFNKLLNNVLPLHNGRHLNVQLFAGQRENGNKLALCVDMIYKKAEVRFQCFQFRLREISQKGLIKTELRFDPVNGSDFPNRSNALEMLLHAPETLNNKNGIKL